jgi:lysophospholipase L1-like esterase
MQVRLLILTGVLAMSLSAKSHAAGTAGFAEFDRRGQAGESLNVVFFGGSLTWGANASDPQRTSYRGLMMAYLHERYPKAPLTFTDAAIGGSGSQLGIFRLERDVLANKPDIVFLDFTANDGLESDTRPQLASYEAILRDLVGRGIPVMQAFFGFRYNFGTSYDLALIPRRRDHLQLAAAYHTATGDVFPFIQAKVESGEETLAHLWPFDGAHPDDPGYKLFFEVMRQGFELAIKEKRVCQVPEKAVFSDTYRNHTRRHLVEHALPEGWTRQKTFRTSLWFDGLSSRWMDDVAACSATNREAVQPLKLEFTGTMVGVFGEADQDGLGFRVLIDGQPVMYQPNKKEPAVDVWKLDTKQFGTGRLFMWRTLADQLAPGRHTLEIRPEFPEGVTKGQLRLESVCFAGE